MPTQRAEIWKAIRGYEGLYEVSNLGNIRRIAITYLKPDISAKGYRRIALSKYGRKKKLSIARLVADAFHGEPTTGMQVNHKDGVRVNDVSDNLEWVTVSENALHRSRVLLRKCNANAA